MKTVARKELTFLAFSLMMLMLGGCVKNEFKIDFEFPEDHIGNYMVSYYAWDKKKGMWMEQTASVQEGVASLGCVTRNPTIVFVSDASNPSNTMTLYAERGDKIKIKGKEKDMWTWSVSGNKLSERWSRWRNETVAGKNDSKKLEKSIEDYVKKNPSDDLSALLLLTEWNMRENTDGFLKLWNSIDGNARRQELIDISASPHLLGIQFTIKADGTIAQSKDSRLESVAFRSRDNGVDTLRFKKGQASLLYFFTENNTNRREARDSLKVLTKEYKDSTRRIIADISVDTDSLSWVAAIRSDSLQGVVRGWEPHGLADEKMARLGVSRIPWLIVKDKSGKEIYAGQDLGEAIKVFRREMDKDKTTKEAPEKTSGEMKPETVKTEAKPVTAKAAPEPPVKKVRPVRTKKPTR